MTRATYSTAPFLPDYDLHLTGERKHHRADENLGAVIADFNACNVETHPVHHERDVILPDGQGT